MQLTVRTDRLVAGGDAMGRADDGRVVFVTGALPGELVDVEVTEEKKDFVRGRANNIVEPSADRVLPVCAHRRAGCGGCGWMHLAVPSQMEAKVDIVRESLRRIGRLDVSTVDRIVAVGGAVDPFGYRTTIRVVGGPDGTIGFREERSDHIVAVNSCPIAESRLSRLLATIELDPGAEVTLRTSVATGAITAIWAREHHKGIRGLPSTVHIGERAWLTEQIGGYDLRVSAGSFFQSGAQGAALLVDAVTRAAPELSTADHAVDAYGGVGLFAVTTMAGAGHVTVIESSKSACFDATQNLAARSATIVKSDVGRWRTESGLAVDVVVADPARSGLGKPGVGALTAPHASRSCGPPVVVLVSCDPVSLARDVTLMAERGYRAESVEVLDLFPNTTHVETVSRFAIDES
jgi:23S rRNA (uracil1939-C5)-methyltransferase